MPIYNVCFCLYCNEDLEADSIEGARAIVITKYYQRTNDELLDDTDVAFSTGDVDIIMAKERREGILVDGKDK